MRPVRLQLGWNSERRQSAVLMRRLVFAVSVGLIMVLVASSADVGTTLVGASTSQLRQRVGKGLVLVSL